MSRKQEEHRAHVPADSCRRRAVRVAQSAIVAATLLLAAANASAVAILSFGFPEAVGIGSQVDVDVNVDALDEFLFQSNFNVHWDPAVLALHSVVATFENQPIPICCAPSPVTSGYVNVFLDVHQTNFSQGQGGDTLFTMVFDAVGLGSSVLTFSPGDGPFDFLAGNLGVEIPALPTTGFVQVVPVTEPRTSWLLAAGLLAGLSFAAMAKQPINAGRGRSGGG